MSIRYCYGVYDPAYEDLNVDLHQGLPTKETIDKWSRDCPHLLVVLDDLMSDVVGSKDVETLFTRGCHHRRMSEIFVTQNLFAQGHVARNLALNTSYLILSRQESGSLSRSTNLSGEDKTLSASIRRCDEQPLWLPCGGPDTELSRPSTCQKQDMVQRAPPHVPDKTVTWGSVVTFPFMDTLENVANRKPDT